MSTATTLPLRRAASPAAWCRRNRHFLIAVGILSLSAIGWYAVALGELGWAIEKRPVPWAPPVTVSEGFRLTSLPRELRDAAGNVQFVLVTEDRDSDGQPDGDVILPEHVTETLRIGTPTDRRRRAARRSNWYFVREYRHVATGRRWRLEGYYYTGVADKVAHVPERCLVAGGARLQRDQVGEVSFDVPAAAPWGPKVPFRRTPFLYVDPECGEDETYVEYYTFSLNGEPTTSWELVRWRLTYPWVRYAYFAKIQFAPQWRVTSAAEADRAAQTFVACFMPEVLKALPMPADVAALQRAGND